MATKAKGRRVEVLAPRGDLVQVRVDAEGGVDAEVDGVIMPRAA